MNFAKQTFPHKRAFHDVQYTGLCSCVSKLVPASTHNEEIVRH